MKKFILCTLSFVALSLIMASCGDNNDPEHGGDEPTEPFICHFRIEELTDSTATVKFEPNQPGIRYFWTCTTNVTIMDDFSADMTAYIESYLSDKSFLSLSSQGLIKNGTVVVRPSHLKPETEYRIMACPVNRDLQITGTISYETFITLEKQEPEIPDPVDPVIGRFSVEQGKQVYFSPGNLQYQLATDSWRFAEHQWDIVGKNNAQISNASYDGWLDLFGYGTGDDPTKYTLKSSDYTTYSEWGNHMPSDGKPWRTLTNDQWLYLFQGRDNADKLFGFGYVNEIRGLIILPDNWTLPQGLTFNPSLENGLELSSTYMYTNSTNYNFSHNTYTAEEWARMEHMGAIFLPYTGLRSKDVTAYLGTGSLLDWRGCYWSSTASPTGLQAAYFWFDRFNFTLTLFTDTCNGHAVRLVRDVP